MTTVLLLMMMMMMMTAGHGSSKSQKIRSETDRRHHIILAAETIIRMAPKVAMVAEIAAAVQRQGRKGLIRVKEQLTQVDPNAWVVTSHRLCIGLMICVAQMVWIV